MFTAASLIAAGYLLGSFSTAIIVSRIMGLPDPRTQGSGNPGATNVMRSGGRTAAAATLVGDLLKGLIPVLAGHALGLASTALAAVGIAAFLGHLFPVFFRFRGGKGVATAGGVLLGLAWPVALLCAATWLVAFGLSRTSAVGALTAALLSPFYTWWWVDDPAIRGAVLAMAVLLIARHQSNIRNLLGGPDGRLRERR